MVGARSVKISKRIVPTFTFCHQKMCRKQCVNSKSKRAFRFLFQNEQVNVDIGIAYGGVVFSVCFC